MTGSYIATARSFCGGRQESTPTDANGVQKGFARPSYTAGKNGSTRWTLPTISVPNVAHLDPQRGGCCTVTPYFIGKVLELPVTATQDYTLFHILKDHSIDLWKKQSELIMEKHGLLSFIVHPDYITTRTERETYEALLGYLRQLREENNVWIATPREVNRWWRQRAQMNLVESSDGWRIDGDGKERAQIAYASEEDGNLKVTFEASSLVS